jgi:hypothetical protein
LNSRILRYDTSSSSDGAAMRYCIQSFVDGAVGLVNGGVRVRVTIRIGICDRNPSEGLPPDHARAL